jgi:hypothetical protein
MHQMMISAELSKEACWLKAGMFTVSGVPITHESRALGAILWNIRFRWAESAAVSQMPMPAYLIS